MAMRIGWGPARITRLNALLRQFVITGINTVDIIERYAEIDAFSQGRHPSIPLNDSARNMGKNDLWIAATASVANAKLLTTDKDFDHLNPDWLELARFDPRATYK